MGVTARSEHVAALLLGSVTFAALTQGAFFGRQLLWLQALVAVTLIVAFLRLHPRAGDVRLPSTVAGAAMSASVLLSASVAGHPRSAVPIVGFLATLATVVVIVTRLDGPSRELVVRGLMVVGSAVALAGWIGVAFRFKPFVIRNGALWRASSTVTYANATACLLVMIGLLALGRLVERGDRAAKLVAWICLVGAGATLSRGGALGLGAGGIVLCLRRGLRPVAAAAWPVAVAALVAIAGLVPSFPRGYGPRPAVAVAALALGAAALWLLPALGPRRALAGLAAAGGLALLVLLGPGSARVRAARGFDISVADRIDRWGEFVEIWASSPLVGRGPGGFLLRYPDPGELDVGRYAHNEYLQVLAEQGIVGVAVLAGTLIYLGKWVLRHSALPGGTAALGALMVHSATDFVWNIPVVPVVGAVIVGICVPSVIASAADRQG